MWVISEITSLFCIRIFVTASNEVTADPYREPQQFLLQPHLNRELLLYLF
jgi:hypothetical protein